MRTISLCLILSMLCIGCNDPRRAVLDAQARQAASIQKLKELGQAMHEKYATESVATHEVVADTEYYTKSPHEEQAADGTFAAGTKIYIIADGEKHVIVRSTEGIEGYVARESIQLLPVVGTDVKK